MFRVILTITAVSVIFSQTSADLDVAVIRKKLEELKAIQTKIVQREGGRIHKEDPRFENELNDLNARQSKYLTHTWNVYSSLTAYVEEGLEQILNDIIKPQKDDIYFEEMMSYLEDIVLKAINSNTKQCQNDEFKSYNCDLQNISPTDCSEVVPKISGITRINHRQNSYLFYCEQDLFNGGWTLIWQSDLSFFIKYRNMTDITSPDFSRFIHGFGKPCTEQIYTLGLEMLHQLTLVRKYQLLIYYKDNDGTTTYSHFEEFAIGSAASGYNATIIGSSFGNATENVGRRKVKKIHPYNDDQRHLLMQVRSFLPERTWGTVQMLLRPNEITWVET